MSKPLGPCLFRAGSTDPYTKRTYCAACGLPAEHARHNTDLIPDHPADRATGDTDA